MCRICDERIDLAGGRLLVVEIDGREIAAELLRNRVFVRLFNLKRCVDVRAIRDIERHVFVLAVELLERARKESVDIAARLTCKI